MDEPYEQHEAELAAAEAGAIGGRRPADVDEADQARLEAGGGEAEGFEQSEELLEAHASHEDQHAARRVIEDAAGFEAAAEDDQADDPARDDPSAGGDSERSSERQDRDY
jgi:hypothetical protein